MLSNYRGPNSLGDTVNPCHIYKYSILHLSVCFLSAKLCESSPPKCHFISVSVYVNHSVSIGNPKGMLPPHHHVTLMLFLLCTGPHMFSQIATMAASHPCESPYVFQLHWLYYLSDLWMVVPLCGSSLCVYRKVTSPHVSYLCGFSPVWVIIFDNNVSSVC